LSAVAQAASALEGRSVTVAGGVVSFGAGSQYGDVTFRDVAGRDINHITLVTPIITAADLDGQTRYLEAVPSGAGAALRPAQAAAPERHRTIRTTPPRASVGFRDR